MADFKNTKIVFVTHYTELYGANRSMLNLIEGITQLNEAKILLVAPSPGKITEEAARLDIECLIIPFHNEIAYSDKKDLKNLFLYFVKGWIRFLINGCLVWKYASKLNSYHIIHTNSSATLIGAYWAFWLKKKHVWHIREFGKEDYSIRYNWGYSYFQYWLNKATAIISISQAIYHKRVKNSKVKLTPVIYNGIIWEKELEVNKGKLSLSDRRGRPGLFFAIVGAISRGKNQLTAVKAFHLLHNENPNIRLWIVGAGDVSYEKELKNYVNEHNLIDCVSFTGHKDEINYIYEMIDCLLMCSKNEAFGRVTVEAMSHAVPVIGYKNAGTQEIIRDGYNGLLYSGGFEELYKKMKLLADNYRILSELQQNAMISAGKYTVEKCTANVISIYRKILE